MKIALMIGAAGMVLVLGNKVSADQIAPCAPPDSSVKVLTFPAAVPDVLLKAFREHVGDVAAPGNRFDATDVVVTGRHRRIIFVWNLGAEYLFATEHGGLAYNDPIFVYRLDPHSHAVTMVSEDAASPSTVCEVSRRLNSTK
jgi:hypothetical protein